MAQSRFKLMNVLQEANGEEVTIYDPCSIDFGSFKWSEGYYKHYLTVAEILKPYLISMYWYGTSAYEDIILALNNIGDIEELDPETVIFIPKITELKTWILTNTKLRV